MSFGETLSALAAAAVVGLIAFLIYSGVTSSNAEDAAFKAQCLKAGGSVIVASGGAAHCVRPGAVSPSN